MHLSINALHAPLIAALAASTFGLVGCAERVPGEDVASNRAAATYPDGALEKTLVPIRTLGVPGRTYMKSIEETYSTTGSLAHSVYVYQPDTTGEGIRFELSAKTSAGAVDTSQKFTQVSLTTHPGESDESRQTLSDASGSVVYSIGTSQSGWYRFNFTYGAVNAGRTLAIKAYDAGGSPLKMAWNDPPGTNVQVRATIAVDMSASVFLKGGAYRTTNPAEYAYVDSVKVDGNLLYRRSFDQGKFAFPLGGLMLGQHTVEFSLNKSGTGAAKFWFGIGEESFDPFGNKFTWDASQFLYWGSMHTGDYDAWNDGVAFAQGASLAFGVRPPPVRRGTSFALALEHASLAGPGNAILRIYPAGSTAETNWQTSLSVDYSGGIMTAAGFSPRNREVWKVNVPSNAAVGKYVVRAFGPPNTQIGSDVVFYVLHNAYPLVTKGAISKAELETFGYDEDEDGVEMQGNFGTDTDGGRDNFTAIYPGSATSGYTQVAKITGAFRRTNNDLGFSMLDYAMASAQGTTTEFESMRRLYRTVAQQLYYTHFDTQDDSSKTFIGNGDGTGFSVEEAGIYSKPNTEKTSWLSGAQCQDYSTILAALARASGIVARATSSQAGLGGWADHYFTEVYIPDLPHQGGKTARTGGMASDTDPWYVFDATDPGNTEPGTPWVVYGESIAPRAEYGKTMLVTSGPPFAGWDVVTTKLGWDPLYTDTMYPADVTSVANAYSSGPEFWLTSSGVTGWIGYGEKDVYRISKASTGAKAVRVRSLPSGGEYLTPALCIAPVGTFPVMTTKCSNVSAHQDLPAGESYVIVLNNKPNVDYGRILRGDTIQYVLELEY